MTQAINAHHTKLDSPFEQGQSLDGCQALVTTTPRNNQVGSIAPISAPTLTQIHPRVIATYYILDVSNSAYCPSTWDLRERWPHRIVYTIFRDAFALEKLMTMCPSWGSAREPQSRISACYHPDHCLQSNGIVFGPTLAVRSTPWTPSHSILSPSTMTIHLRHSASHRIISFALLSNALVTFAESTIPEAMLALQRQNALWPFH